MVNKAAKPDSYPLPRIEDLFTRLAVGKHFSKLDIAHVYQQIPLSEKSKQYVTLILIMYRQSVAFWSPIRMGYFLTCYGESTGR